jgi:hypothetical protein
MKEWKGKSGEEWVRIGRGVNVCFDPQDPDTPVMVYGPCNSSATFFCADDTGELSGDEDVYLSADELDNLRSLRDRAEDFFNDVREKAGY